MLSAVMRRPSFPVAVAALRAGCPDRKSRLTASMQVNNSFIGDVDPIL
jgi:hypothetical protein